MPLLSEYADHWLFKLDLCDLTLINHINFGISDEVWCCSMSNSVTTNKLNKYYCEPIETNNVTINVVNIYDDEYAIEYD